MKREIVSEKLNGQEVFVIKYTNDLGEVKYSAMTFPTPEDGHRYLEKKYGYQPREYKLGEFADGPRARELVEYAKKAANNGNEELFRAVMKEVYAGAIMLYKGLKDYGRMKGVHLGNN